MQEKCSDQGKHMDDGFEMLRVKKTANSCGISEDFVEQNQAKPYAVVSCEGACLRGEISRRAADQLCHRLAPDRTARICQGSAVTKDAGQRNLVRNADHLLILEGCAVQCASRLLGAFETKAKPTIIFTDRLASFDGNLFGSNELPSGQIDAIAETVAQSIIGTYF